MNMLSPGDVAPDFTLTTGAGTTVSLRDFRGKKVVLFFYPKDDTPGCTKEACSFQDHIGILDKKGAVVLGISADGVDSHAAFADKFGLTFPLLSDPEKSVIKGYGVWQKKTMYGRIFHGIVRTTFVIDERGKIARVFERVKVDGHIQEVLEAL